MTGKFGVNHLVTAFFETVTKNYANVTFGHGIKQNHGQIYKLACIGQGFIENRDKKYTNMTFGHSFT